MFGAPGPLRRSKNRLGQRQLVLETLQMRGDDRRWLRALHRSDRCVPKADIRRFIQTPRRR
jgi:hypothetical protein